jgi:NAD(P)-dependent dehydrogenase (short-subunit alcohol dehydrogenase family)
MRTILVTGANRGIGLLLTRLYAEREGTLVFAACRDPDRATELAALAAERPESVRIVALEVTSPASIAACAAFVREATEALDVLVNNAGILPGGVAGRLPSSSRLGRMEAEPIVEVFAVNTVGPLMVTQAFLPLLRAGKRPRVVNVSSDAGSITQREKGGSYSYPASKAALNMMTRCLAGDLREDKIIVVSVHPGFVRTDMGGPGAPRVPEETIPSLLRVVEDLSLEDSSRFLNWDGAEIPW